jgi:CO dehydrogenase maturation factor
MFKIAITGKGGVGKTTIAGILSRLLARDGYEVLAIDADPSMNLASTIGIRNQPRPLTEYRELIEERAGSQEGFFRINPKVSDIVEKFSALGPDSVRLLVLGTIEKGGEGCMCLASAFLRALLRYIFLKEKSLVVLDMEAGIEHLGRGTTRGIDLMVIVVEPGSRSLETAERILKLGRDIGIKNFAYILNKARGEVLESRLRELGVPLIAIVPYDEALIQADIGNIPPIEAEGKYGETMSRLKDKIVSLIQGAEPCAAAGIAATK